MNPIVPPVTGVNHAILAFTPTEVLITFGQTRQMIQDMGEGRVGINPFVEWLHTAAMSPTAALQLQAALTEALVKYAGQFGQIPQDKGFMHKISPGEANQ